jgi:hypothetical protein
VAALVGFVAVEQPARPPCAILEPALPGVVDAGGAVPVGRRDGDCDALASDQIVLRSGLENEAAMLASPLLGRGVLGSMKVTVKR